MNGLFYMKLALRNIRKNAQTYVPYMLTCTGSVMMFHIMFTLASSQEIQNMNGGSDMHTILNFGCVIISFFTSIFLFYTNNFLMKRRKKEIGLYNILGMGKRHIGKVMFFETVYIGGASLFFGITGGFLLSKVIYLLLLRLLHSQVQWGFHFSQTAAISSVFLYGTLFFLILAANLAKVHVSSPIELLKGEQLGEREPKSRWGLAIMGIVTLGLGYYLALTTRNPLLAINAFFLAAILVIIGTYCLFIAGSIVFLKILKKNKSFFYRTDHFISTSGLLYRMKQNAAGLAGICILSTAVLVMLSSTAALYAGMDDILITRYPREIMFRTWYLEEESRNSIKEAVEEVLSREKISGANQLDYRQLSLMVIEEGSGVFRPEEMIGNDNLEKICSMYIVPLEDYNQIVGEQAVLSEEECLVITHNKPYEDKTLSILGETYQVASGTAGKYRLWEGADTFGKEVYYVIVPSMDQIQILADRQQETLGTIASGIQYHYELDLNAEREDQVRVYEEIMAGIAKRSVGIRGECREAMRSSYFSLNAGLLFLGIFLGVLFVMATALMVYYKQVTEGYEDKERFEIMQKVGLSKAEIKSSIRSQILLMFFLPLVTAVIHIMTAFPIITRLLAAMNLTNAGLFMLTTAGTVAVFTVIYSIVYLLTSKVYLKIVS